VNTRRLPSHCTLRWPWLTALLLGAVIPLGCDTSVSVPSTVPVKGVVKIKGKPARGIRVTFHNKDASRAKSFVPTGETGPDGGFTLSTGAPQNGAPPGTYNVTFEKPTIDPKNPVETEIDLFKGRYSDREQSKWTVKIENGENALPPFELD
jgi:hypothetical protein